MVALWQAYGFVHGVLNTDNMSILGETFDYGPYTFLDSYDPDHVANNNDDGGRYAFFRQPAIVHWNLACLAQALLPLIPREALEAALEGFMERVTFHQMRRQKARLGLQTEQAGDSELVSQLWQLFEQQKIDITRFLSALTELSVDQLNAEKLQAFTHTDTPAWSQWFQAYQQRVQLEPASGPIRHQQMRSVNPYYLLRNYMAEEAIREATQGDYRLVNQLLPILRHPCELHTQAERFLDSPPDWAGSICLSCSS
ncbi:protein adenylyltransferase SelO family protein [Nitrincola sp. A-D6]|uniref:protein adenylyltransferase SelO family protein n=1 Tax=Nitrincola sp. A-D6 TaxID=1545442 RepID=UPI002286C6D4|nr:protein adenylyltransferase SelO family protein [Nitrincola sp. A-D6]